jgi:alkanesulfonate monooxygenase SsuD/methylene tetrahydromethanopterin reductase-like flavin-dependent oxidoreductase (luciferase family)
MAGELTDGFVCHPTNSHPVVLKSRTLPALAEGAARAGRTEQLAVVANPHVMAAATSDAVDALREQRRSELAFLYSTPAYRRQLEDFGLADLGAVLSAMAKESEWDDLPTVLTDEVMSQLVPQGTYDEIPAVLTQWYSGLCSGINLPVPTEDADDDSFGALLDSCRQIPAAVRNSA